MLSVASPIDPLPTRCLAETIRPPTFKSINPVVPCCEYALRETDTVHVSDAGVRRAAEYISLRMYVDEYTPRTWRTHPLHIHPPERYAASDPRTKECLDWIFLIASLNFSFWSEKDGSAERYGVEWRKGWDTETRSVHTGYWSLVAAVNRALEENVPITDPRFYASEDVCPDELIAHVFRAASESKEEMPLLGERIAIMRQVGMILCNRFGGSYAGLLDAFQRSHGGRGTALDLVQIVVDAFPSFRDEQSLGGHPVLFWKRAQILVAETWAAFFPADASAAHPLFSGISALTMFADYRVPQILHHLGILVYPSSLQDKLRNHRNISPGSREEISLRAASIIGVERIRDEIVRLRGYDASRAVCSVLIDFYLWDLAKRIEDGKDRVDGIDSVEILPAHRTRSIWY